MTPDEVRAVVDRVTPAEIREAVEIQLRQLGLTEDELRELARRGSFPSGKARALWLSIEHFAENV